MILFPFIANPRYPKKQYIFFRWLVDISFENTEDYSGLNYPSTWLI
jgi:hypothetical protein